MNLSQLRFAQSLAAAGSFTSAAAACFVTQPTLSNGIAELENELGQKLFARTTRKVALTEFGSHMLPAIAEVLKAQEALAFRAKAYLHPHKRLIRIGTSPLISPAILKAIVEPFQRQSQAVDLIFREMNCDDLNKMLHDGRLDFIFCAKGSPSGSRARKLERTFLYREPLFFIPPHSVWRGPMQNRSVKVDDISEETFVMVPDTCGLAQATRALFRSHRCKIHEYSGQALSYQVLEQWADLGIGAAVLPKSKVTLRSDCSLAIVEKGGVPATIEFEALWSDPDKTILHRVAFAKHLRKVVPTLTDGLV
ncbi:MAG TPA: LysR family transcriptional regulator [Opitutaceae bacterium]|nr:LysR family transcriptional regulator [Opitutaceae bacterium]